MEQIKIEDLSFTYPGAKAPILNHVDLKIRKGDFLAIVGNNGCGKSTLCKILNGLIPHFISGEFSGKVLINGENTQDQDIGSLARKVGYVYQDFENQIVRPTVLDDASYACLNYGMEDHEERALGALRQCGLTGKEKEYIWQLSGGQTHLLALAGAVALGPDILILDEPIAQLDPGHADCIYEVLKELNERYGKTIIVIEHHTEYIAEYCKHVLLLSGGKVKWMLPVREALGQIEELQTNDIYPPQITLAAHRMKAQGILSQETVLPTTLEEGRQVFAGLKYQGGIRSCEKKIDKTECAVTFEQVTVSYPGVKGQEHKVFDGLDLELHKGEKIALIGSNGAGKSTLMKLMVGLLRPAGGQIRLNGSRVKEIGPEQLSRQISFVYQNPEEMFIRDSIYGDIAYAMQMRKIPDWKEKTQELLERFRLKELAERDGRLLSGGQMRRASLAIGIALDPGILLLDEPTANLDIATRKEITRTLEDIKDITETVMIATHDMQLVCQWAERIIVLYKGKVVADGNRDEIFGDDSLASLVGIRPPEIFLMGQALKKQALCYTVDEFLYHFQKQGGRKHVDEAV